MSVEVRLVACLSDNYAVLLRDSASNMVAAIDAPEVEPIVKALEEAKWKLTHILVTHKHADHIQGIPALKDRYKPKVIGPHGFGLLFINQANQYGLFFLPDYFFSFYQCIFFCLPAQRFVFYSVLKTKAPRM
jgi:glyoxylase-like metal-dependent hydrolase (beta-lactamase superfamily II)